MVEGKSAAAVVASTVTSESVRLSEEILARYREAQTDWKDSALASDSFANGNHWLPEDIATLEERGESPVKHNVTGAAIKAKIALLTANNPSFQAAAEEDSDVGMGQVFSNILSYIWNKSGGSQQLKIALKHYCQRGGRGVQHIYFDPKADFGKGEVRYRALDPLKVFPDPNSSDPLWRDAAHVLYADLITDAQVEHFYPDFADRIKEKGKTTAFDDNALKSIYTDEDPVQLGHQVKENWHQKYLLIERYSKIMVPYKRIFDPGSGLEQVFTREEFNEWLRGLGFLVSNAQGEDAVIGGRELEEVALQYAEMGGDGEAPVTFHYKQEVDEEGNLLVNPYPGVEDEFSIEGSTQTIAPIPRETLLKNDLFDAFDYDQPRIRMVLSIGGVLIHDVVLPIDAYPLVPIMNNFNGNPYPSDDVHDVKEIQQEVNFIQQKIQRHAAESSGHTIMVPRGAVDEGELAAKLAMPGTKVVYYDPDEGVSGGGIHHLQVPPLNSELYHEKDRLIAMIERLIGVYEFQQGQGAAAPETFRGTIAQDEFAQRRIKSDLDNIEAGLSEAGRVIIQYVQAYWTTEKSFRILNPNTKELTDFVINEVRYNDYTHQIEKINNVTVGNYDVRVVSGSTMPSNRFAQQDYYTNLYQLGVIDQVELLKKLEVFDIEGVLQRSGEKQQMLAYIEQLEQEVKNLEGDMQTADREIRHKDRQISAEKFKRELSSIHSEVKAQERVFQERREDALRDIKQSQSSNNNV